MGMGKGMSGAERLAISAIVILASIFPVEWLPIGLQLLHGTDGQLSGKQGQVLLVRVPVQDESAQVTGQFRGRRIPFFAEFRAGEKPGFLGLLGIDMQEEPGTHPLDVDVQIKDDHKPIQYMVAVSKEQYAVEKLTLPKGKVDLDQKGLDRYKAEQEQIRQALAEDSGARIWSSSFVEPVAGRNSGRFGSVRVLNGQPKTPHRGEDIAAPLGQDVVASNDGVVRLTVDHVFSGKGIYLDHGLGLYSMYFHLSEINVRDGERVTAGQVIGKVGATGRATGPHLHWGTKVNGAWVNPFSLVELPISAAHGSAQSASR